MAIIWNHDQREPLFWTWCVVCHAFVGPFKSYARANVEKLCPSCKDPEHADLARWGREVQ
jgi:hypothetical protein